MTEGYNAIVKTLHAQVIDALWRDGVILVDGLRIDLYSTKLVGMDKINSEVNDHYKNLQNDCDEPIIIEDK